MKTNRVMAVIFTVFLLLFSTGCTFVTEALGSAIGSAEQVTGVDIPESYCELAPLARCALEQRIEEKVNQGIESVGEAAVVNVDIMCPNDDANFCAAPDLDTGSEAGDYRAVRAVVEGDP